MLPIRGIQRTKGRRAMWHLTRQMPYSDGFPMSDGQKQRSFRSQNLNKPSNYKPSGLSGDEDQSISDTNLLKVLPSVPITFEAFPATIASTNGNRNG